MKKFELELEHLKSRVIAMGETADLMIALSTTAILGNDLSVIERVIDHEARLDRFQVELDGEAIRLITIYTPIAKDLRVLLMMARITAELERIGDQAVNNCEYVQSFANAPAGPLDEIAKMADITRAMVHDALEAFDQEDTEKAEAVLKVDDQVDQLYNETFRHLAEDASQDPPQLGRSMNLILVARSLERIADHATNICEEVIYMVRSEDIRHKH